MYTLIKLEQYVEFISRIIFYIVFSRGTRFVSLITAHQWIRSGRDSRSCYAKVNYGISKVSSIQVTDCKERVIELRALMSARNSDDAFDLRCHVREKLIEFIQHDYSESLPKTRSEVMLS